MGQFVLQIGIDGNEATAMAFKADFDAFIKSEEAKNPPIIIKIIGSSYTAQL